MRGFPPKKMSAELYNRGQEEDNFRKNIKRGVGVSPDKKMTDFKGVIKIEVCLLWTFGFGHFKLFVLANNTLFRLWNIKSNE